MGPSTGSPDNSLFFLKLLPCRKVSEMSYEGDPWVTIMLQEEEKIEKLEMSWAQRNHPLL